MLLRVTQMDGSVDGNKPLARVDLWPVTWYAQRSGYLVWSLLSSPIPISSAHHILAYLNISQFSHHFQLLGGWKTILKNMSSSMGRMTSHIWWKIKVMFETTMRSDEIDGFFLFYPHKITISLGKSPYDVTTKQSGWLSPETPWSNLQIPQCAGEWLARFCGLWMIPNHPGSFMVEPQQNHQKRPSFRKTMSPVLVAKTEKPHIYRIL